MSRSIDTIHVIFKTHLDVGFTDFARNVVASYHRSFLPQAIATAQELRQRCGPERFIWTAGAWLIHDALRIASAQERDRLEQAIVAGDITWHGLPFTTHSELATRSLFRFGLTFAGELDQRFGRRTIAAKLTDVPGHTRAIVPLLAGAGIQFLHIGVNPASTPPDVPPVFVWRDPDGSEIIVMYQRGSYGDLVVVPGLSHALTFAHTGDNLGPQSPAGVLDEFARLRAQFSEATIRASTLDAFATQLATIKAQLPVVTAELGDTWIHGAGTDPQKVAAFRELCRLRETWLTANRNAAEDQAIKAFSRTLLMVPEHTWGLDVKTHLRDWAAYSADRFGAARTGAAFRKMEESWAEQRRYLDDAVTALGNTTYATQARDQLAALQPQQPALPATIRMVGPGERIRMARFVVGFDPGSGAINCLQDAITNRAWASEGNCLAVVRYQTFNAADYERFYRRYIINKRQTGNWSRADFTKPGLEHADVPSRFWLPILDALYHERTERGERFVATLSSPAEAIEAYGAPRMWGFEFLFPDDASEIQLRVQWFDKPACRLPEALWLSFAPRIADVRGWRLDKLGEAIDPRDVVRDGNRHLHAIERGVSYHDAHGSLTIDSLDAPLAAPGEPALLNFTNRMPSLRHGMHFNLYNNVWGTNFPMWSDEDASFRFVLRLG